MQNILNFGKKLITSHKFTAGTALIAEMTETMHVVIALDPSGWVINSRNFAFTESCKKEVLKECRAYYNFVKDCLCKKQLNLLEEAD